MHIEWDKYQVEIHGIGRSRAESGVKKVERWTPRFLNPDHDLLFYTGGKGRIELQSGWTMVSPGLCLWLRPGHPYNLEQDPDDPLWNSFIHFDLVDARGRKRSQDAPLPPERIDPPDLEMIEVVTRRIIDMSFGFGLHGLRDRLPEGDTGRVARGLLTGLLMELDAAGERRKDVTAVRLNVQQQRLVQAAAARLMDAPDLQYEPHRLAREAGCSADHFARLFRKHTGMNPEQFAIRARIQRAERLLRDADLPVKEIALALGYSELNYFSRQFKQIAGKSPSEYRQQARAERTATA